MSGDPRFLELLQKMRSVHENKRSDYAKEFDSWKNFRANERHGVKAWEYALYRFNEKCDRLNNVVENGKSSCEDMQEACVDIANFSLIVLCTWEEDQNKTRIPCGIDACGRAIYQSSSVSIDESGKHVSKVSDR